MRIYFSIVLAALTVTGCRTTFLDDPFGDDRKANLDVDAWSAPLADVSSMFDVRIPHFEVKVIPRTAALQKLESVWRSEVGGKALPVSFGAVPEEPWERNISFSATAASVRELLYIIAELSGERFIDGDLCGSIRIENRTGKVLPVPQSTRLKHLFIFDGFKEEESAQQSPAGDEPKAAPEERRSTRRFAPGGLRRSLRSAA